MDKLEFDTEKLDNLIERSFWKDVLLEVIADLNPWDVDLVELATKYSKKVEKMRELNFRIPANVIIVSSVLLRMKSDLLRFSGPNLEYDLESWISDGEFLDVFSDGMQTQIAPEGGLVNLEIDPKVPIQLKPQRVTKRRITALELIAAIQEVLEDKERIKIKSEKPGREDMVIKETFDIKKAIEATYLKVMEVLMRKKFALFSEIIKEKEELIPVFISLLHLSNNKKVKLKQEKLFGDIFISAF